MNNPRVILKVKPTSTSGLTNKNACFPESHSYVKDAVYVYRRGCSVHSVCRVQCARRCTALCTKLRLATVIYVYTVGYFSFLLVIFCVTSENKVRCCFSFVREVRFVSLVPTKAFVTILHYNVPNLSSTRVLLIFYH